ncbi:uncharacterized protein B0H18DRAFT_1211560 [Fomitopsis serialis]|uniref:uncharacterized protein n=1 Tax=Fomitopsis serialis TaxID=139415 RepID=UPI00200757EC|nr:uncharacterized protein B0H18DRAFT_1211560 [Neoantrodia serialis]KAH9925127.1 hypothetical protein B0H18DRAFT_1211560 [Neoantrodia serialis]
MSETASFIGTTIFLTFTMTQPEPTETYLTPTSTFTSPTTTFFYSSFSFSSVSTSSIAPFASSSLVNSTASSQSETHTSGAIGPTTTTHHNSTAIAVGTALGVGGLRPPNDTIGDNRNPGIEPYTKVEMPASPPLPTAVVSGVDNEFKNHPTDEGDVDIAAQGSQSANAASALPGVDGLGRIGQATSSESSISPPPSFVAQPSTADVRTSFNLHIDSGIRFDSDPESPVPVPRRRVVYLPPTYTVD